jgi:hypothetical protein
VKHLALLVNDMPRNVCNVAGACDLHSYCEIVPVIASYALSGDAAQGACSPRL